MNKGDGLNRFKNQQQ